MVLELSSAMSVKNWRNWQNLDPKIPQNWNSLCLEWGTTLRNHPGVDVNKKLAELAESGPQNPSELEFPVAGMENHAS